MWDFAIDPSTGDLVMGNDGSFATVEHAGTSLILQIASHLNAWWGDPATGSRLHDLRAMQVDPVKLVTDEARRALGVLVAAGAIADVRVSASQSPTDVARGRVIVRTECRDISSGRRVDLLIPVGAH